MFLDLKMPRVLEDLILGGREFHKLGPTTENASCYDDITREGLR